MGAPGFQFFYIGTRILRASAMPGRWPKAVSGAQRTGVLRVL